jgi:hypothetical protein
MSSNFFRLSHAEAKLPEARSGNIRLPIPREHGAWGILLQSFFAGAVLSREASWLLLPALGLAVLGFSLKEPVQLVIRHSYLWRRETFESKQAARWVAAEVAILILCLAALFPRVSGWTLVALAITAIALTVLAVWLTVTNRRRSMPLQLLSSAGLCTASLLAVLAVKTSISAWAWILWAVLASHAAASIPIVHARLQLKTAARASVGVRTRQVALAGQFVQLAAAAVLVAYSPMLSMPLLFSSAAGIYELHRLRSEENLGEPLRRVGFRLLGTSIGHTVLTIWVLWPLVDSF